MTPAARDLIARLDEPSRIWLESASSRATTPTLWRRFLAASALCYEPETARTGEPAWLFRGTSAAELVRICLVLCAMERTEDPRGLARDWYRAADDHGKRAVLRALPLVERPERHDHLAAIACRSDSLFVFESICCENPYPALYFGDAAFSQMVLRADFVGVDVERIIGVDRWRHTEHRRAAGSIPAPRAA